MRNTVAQIFVTESQVVDKTNMTNVCDLFKKSEKETLQNTKSENCISISLQANI